MLTKKKIDEEFKNKKNDMLLYIDQESRLCTKMENGMQFSYTEIQLRAVYSHLEGINWDS